MAARADDKTRVERTSDRELTMTRHFNAPAPIVFAAWSRPELFKRWWAPKSSGVPLRACDMDVRTGGRYRLEFGKGAAHAMAFFGRYIEVTPPTRIVWTNEESEAGAVTTVSFTGKDGQTLLVLREVYPTKEALDLSIEGMEGCMPEQFAQLDELLEVLKGELE